MFITIALWYDDDVYDRMKEKYPEISEGDIHFDDKLDECYDEIYDYAYEICHELIDYAQNSTDIDIIDWECDCDAEY